MHVEMPGISGEADLVTSDFKVAWAYFTMWALTDAASSVKCWLETKKE